MRKQIIIFFLYLAASGICQNQPLPTLSPQLGRTIAYTQQESNEFSKVIDDFEAKDYEAFTGKEKKLWDLIENFQGPLTHTSACSWYCGGGPDTVFASSCLPTSKSASYTPGHVHDYNLLTAWCPENQHNGIGESISFLFSLNGPKITKILIYNGYMKTNELWHKNGRVKEFRLSFNNKPYAILALQYTSAEQQFSISPITAGSPAKPLLVKFEILSVYPGTKYSDVAISEINFDGTGVHCFPAGTKISLPGNQVKNIEDIRPGDGILTYHQATWSTAATVVEKTASVRHAGLITYIIDGGIRLTATREHPLLVNGNSWENAAEENPTVQPVRTTGGVHENAVAHIKVGDRVNVLQADG